MEPWQKVIYLVRSGSRAYGTNTPESDLDIRGICIPPAQYIAGLSTFEQRVEEKPDRVIFAIHKFFKLALDCNPNIIEMLFVRDEDLLQTAPEGVALRNNRELFLSRHAFNTFGGYAYAQLKKLQNSTKTARHGTHADFVEKYGYDCYEDATTEFLTDNGWKCFDDVHTTDKLATVDVGTGALEFQYPTGRTDKQYTGYLYGLESYCARVLVTPGHNVLVSSAHRSRANRFSAKYCADKADWKLLPVRDALNGRRSHYHIRIAPAERSCEYPVEDSYLKLLGLYLSDGTTAFRKKNGTVKSVVLTQTKSGNFHVEADALMQTYPFRKYTYPKQAMWVAHGDIARRTYTDCGHASNKHLPCWAVYLSARQAKVLWDALMLGDGTKHRAFDTYYTNSKTLADGIQACMVLSGLQCNVDGPYESVARYGTCRMYHVIRSNLRDTVRNTRLNHRNVLRAGESRSDAKRGYCVKEIEVGDRRVVCFEVPNGTLITRNGGRVAIHGNCKAAGHLVRLYRSGVELLRDGELQVYRPDREELLDIRNGKWSLVQIEAEAARLNQELQAARDVSPLPRKPDYAKAEKLLLELVRPTLEEYYAHPKDGR